jgi:membrane fusion protein, multidrug efflux system
MLSRGTSRRVRLWMIVAATAWVGAGCNGGETAEAQQRTGGGGGGNQGAGPGGGRGGGGGVPVVDVAPVTRGSIARSVTVSGVVAPIRTVGVNSQLPGAILSLHAEEGDRVAAGEPLARMDDREIRAQLTAAVAAFEVADAAYQRAIRLKDQQVITLAEYERDRTARAAAKSQLDQLRARAGYAVVSAPIGGVVTDKRVEAGDVVNSQTRLFTVADVSTLVVRVGVSELDVVELSPGDRAAVGLDAYPGRVFSGRVRRVFPAGDPTTRLVPVEVALDSDDATVARPGFLARVTFDLNARTDVLLIPAGAIVAGAGAEAVFVVDGDRALRRSVRTGLHSRGMVEVLGGLEEGERVVTAGNNTLRDGTEVRLVRANDAVAP